MPCTFHVKPLENAKYRSKAKNCSSLNGLLLGNCAVWLIYIILILGNIRKHLEGTWRAEDNFGNQFSSLWMPSIKRRWSGPHVKLNTELSCWPLRTFFSLMDSDLWII